MVFQHEWDSVKWHGHIKWTGSLPEQDALYEVYAALALQSQYGQFIDLAVEWQRTPKGES